MKTPPAAGGAISVDAQWALHGKMSDAQGYKVLACSAGELSRDNFTDAIGRFALGALDTLPQVSVSFVQHATRPDGSYLALAINWYAVPGQRHAAGVEPLDDHGRQTSFTSYFCASYKHLAEHAVTYLDLYDAFGAVTLPVKDGPAETVDVIPSMLQVPAVGELELRAAALLLTGSPVCVLGAERTSMRERLGFIDTVMALLPYGFRAKMTAATWTKATNRDHRFRLFFSSAPRSVDQPDHVLTWNQPDQGPFPRGHALEYIDLLSEKLSPVARLRELTTEIGFGPKAATQALELLDGTRVRPPRRPAEPAPAGPGARGKQAKGGPPARRDPAPVAAPADEDPNERVLRECADHIRDGSTTGLRSDIRWLENQAKTAQIDETRRQRYQALIGRYKLLHPHPELRKQEGELCSALLAVAFARPFGYRAYCQVETCLGVKAGTRLHPALLSAMERNGLAGQVVTAIVFNHQDIDKLDKLDKWFKSGRVDPVKLITHLGRQWVYPAHAEILCEVTLIFLGSYQDYYHPGEVRRELRERGFLAQALYLRHHEQEQYQFGALHQFLLAAYPSGLDRAAIVQVLSGARKPPTPALFAAVLKLIAAPDDWELACKAYAYGSAAGIEIDQASSAQLLERVPNVVTSAILTDRERAGLSGAVQVYRERRE